MSKNFVLKKMLWMDKVDLLKIEMSDNKDSVSHSKLRVRERIGSTIESGSRNFI
jgi:hypothetical protein